MGNGGLVARVHDFFQAEIVESGTPVMRQIFFLGIPALKEAGKPARIRPFHAFSCSSPLNKAGSRVVDVETKGKYRCHRTLLASSE